MTHPKTATHPLRIGILKTDSVRPEFIGQHGDYPDMFRTLLTDAAEIAGLPPPEFETYDVQHGRYPGAPEDCDGYVITGSRDSVYDAHAWIAELGEYVRELHRRRHKLIGICFGHQLVAQALGGETTAAEVGWAVGVHGSRLTARPPWLVAEDEGFALLSSHKDQVRRLPEGAELLAASDFCPIAAFTVGDHILALQGHPEFVKPYAHDLMRFRETLLGPEVFARGIASLAEPVQRMQVGRWMLDFLSWRAPADARADIHEGRANT